MKRAIKRLITAARNRENTQGLIDGITIYYFVFIVTSESGDNDFDVVRDTSDTLCIDIDGEHFESDAYHCQTWCDEHGYKLTIVEKKYDHTHM